MYHRLELYIPDMFTNLAIPNCGTASQPSCNRQGMSMRHMSWADRRWNPESFGSVQCGVCWTVVVYESPESQLVGWCSLQCSEMLKMQLLTHAKGWAKCLRHFAFSQRSLDSDMKALTERIRWSGSMKKTMETRVNSLKFYTIMYIIC